jgi:chemotaxis protein MotB
VRCFRRKASATRFLRIEGVADREPFVPGDRYDPRNRRMSVILAWSKGLDKALGKGTFGRGAFARGTDEPKTDPDEGNQIKRRIAVRDGQAGVQAELRKLDLGKTALPADANVINAQDIPKRNALTPPGRTEATTHPASTPEKH